MSWIRSLLLVVLSLIIWFVLSSFRFVLFLSISFRCFALYCSVDIYVMNNVFWNIWNEINKFKIMHNTTENDNNNLMISLTRSNDDKIALFLWPCMLSISDWCVRRILMSITNRRPKTPQCIFFIAVSTKIIKNYYYFPDKLMYFSSVFILFFLNNIKSILMNKKPTGWLHQIWMTLWQGHWLIRF